MSSKRDRDVAWSIASEIDDPIGGAIAALAERIATALATARAEGYDQAVMDRENNL